MNVKRMLSNMGNVYNKREIHTAIEAVKAIPVGRFIPREFSMAYM